MKKVYDVIVVGGGHAGCEAAAASARMGADTVLITHKISTIGEMSCNPAIGGLGKGHLVREVDALDGLMGKVIDKAGIQFRMLNSSKGPAVRGPRAQADRDLYKKYMLSALQEQNNLEIVEDSVEGLLLDSENNKFEVKGVKLADDTEIVAKAVVLTTGTFLNGIMFVGHKTSVGGRVNDVSCNGITPYLNQLGLKTGRLKTGTPARLNGKTINWSILAEQCGDDNPEPFSYLTDVQELNLVEKCKKLDVGFLAMKAMGGGLITNSKAAYAFMANYDNVLPIWGIQRESELDEFISYQENPPVLDDKLKTAIKKDKQELGDDFCRGCGYCMPCPNDIEINTCARMSLWIRRMPTQPSLSEDFQSKMKQAKKCDECRECIKKCPYSLNIPQLLKENIQDYENILNGKTIVD